MEYNSFYGGRRGASFVIVKKYRVISEDDSRIDSMIKKDLGLEDESSITDTQRTEWLSEYCMTYCFKQAGAYKTVNYDEYVLIDTVNKNDKDNGKIYRRGYEYNNDMGGAIYVGQIVGPAGMAPHVEMTTIEAVNELASEENLSLTDINGEFLYRKTEGEYAPTDNLIPGQYYDENGDAQYNDTIQYAACSVRDANSHITTVYLGFIIPYPVMEYTAESVSPYYHRTDAVNQEMENWDETGDTTDFDNDKLAVREDDLEHPFYSRWHFSIPKGKKGESLNNFRVTTVEEEDDYELTLQDYDGMEDDRNTTEVNKRQILVYDYYNYDRDAGGDPVTLYLGDYNMIESFRIDDDGTVTIDYSHDDEDVYKNLFKWIKSISLNEDTGYFEIIYNYDEEEDGTPTKLSQYLTWLKDMDVKEDGTITWTFTTPEDDRTYPQYLKWIKQVALNPETGLFEIDFNYETEPDGKTDMDGNDISGQDTHYEMSLQWVKDITIAEDGTVTFIYTNQDDTVYPNFIKWVESIALNPETGLFEVDFNYETDPDTEEPTHYEMSLQWVKDIKVDEYGTITFNYTNQEDTVYQNYMKWIKSVSLDTDTGYFEVQFNYDKTRDGEELANEDTTYSTYLRYIKNVVIDDDGTMHFEYSYGEEVEFTKLLKYISNITLNAETGHFEVIYNQETDSEGNPTKYETDLRWVKEVTIDEEGTITFDYTNGEDTVYENYFKTIKSVTLNSVTGLFEIIYNYDEEEDGTPTKYETTLKWVDGIKLAEDGTVTVTYTTEEETVLDNKIKWVTQTTLGTDGTLTFTYNDSTTETFSQQIQWISSVTLDETGVFTVKYNNGTEDYTTTIRWPVSISVDTGEVEGDGTQKINVSYSDGTTETIGNPINYIMETAISNDFHLLVLYSDPEKRGGVTYEDRSDWTDLGYIGQGTVGAVVGKESDEAVAAIFEALPPYSAWFIVEEDE